MDIQDAIKIAEPSLYTNMGSSNCNFGGVGEKYHRPHVSQACHYNGRNKWSKEIEYYYSTVSRVDGGQKDLEKLLALAQWGLSNNSPWSKLTKDRKSQVLTNGKTVGYILEVKTQDDLCLLMNMSIGLRFPREYAGAWEFMKVAMDEGIPMEDAFYLASQFSLNDKSGVVSNGGHASGSHSIVEDAFYRYRGDKASKVTLKFDFKRFSESNPRPSQTTLLNSIEWIGTPINDVFQTKKLPAIEAIQDRVKDSGAVVGRWTKTPGGKTVDSVIKVWNDGYRKELIEHFANAA